MSKSDTKAVNGTEASVLETLFPVCDRDSKREDVDKRKDWQKSLLTKLSTHSDTKEKIERRVSTRGVTSNYLDNLQRIQGQR